MEHLRMTLKLFRKHKLYASLSKCDFYKNRIHYLGHSISDKGISVDPEKIEAIMIWPAPRKRTNVRSFVGLVVYCKNFTEGYSVGKMEPMYRLRRHACELVVP